MSEPIVFISHHRVKPGKAEEVKALTAESWSTMKTEKPRTPGEPGLHERGGHRGHVHARFR